MDRISGMFAFYLQFPYFYIWLVLVLAICFAIIYSGKGLFRIGKEDINNSKGSLPGLVFALWGIELAAWLIVFFVSLSITGGDLFIYLAIWFAIYILCFLPSCFLFKRILTYSNKKYKKLFVYFLIVNAIAGVILSYVCLALAVIAVS